MGELVNNFLIGDKIDIAGTIDVNIFNGIKNVQMTLKNIIKSIG